MLKKILSWFKPKKEPVEVKEPDKLISIIHAEIMQATSVQDYFSKNEAKAKTETERYIYWGDVVTKVSFTYDEVRLTVSSVYNGDVYEKDYHGLFATGSTRWVSGGEKTYRLEELSLYNKKTNNWVEIDPFTIVNFNVNEANKPLLREIFKRATQLYYQSEEYKRKRKVSQEMFDEMRSTVNDFISNHEKP